MLINTTWLDLINRTARLAATPPAVALSADHVTTVLTTVFVRWCECWCLIKSIIIIVNLRQLRVRYIEEWTNCYESRRHVTSSEPDHGLNVCHDCKIIRYPRSCQSGCLNYRYVCLHYCNWIFFFLSVFNLYLSYCYCLLQSCYWFQIILSRPTTRCSPCKTAYIAHDCSNQSRLS